MFGLIAALLFFLVLIGVDFSGVDVFALGLMFVSLQVGLMAFLPWRGKG